MSRRFDEFHVFPFNLVKPGSRIVIYGAGEVGREYYLQVRAIGYCEVLFMADRDYAALRPAALARLEPPEAVFAARDYDYVVAAAHGREREEEIRAFLSAGGVRPERIVCGNQGRIQHAHLFLSGGTDLYKTDYLGALPAGEDAGVVNGVQPARGRQRAIGIADDSLRRRVLDDPLFKDAMILSGGRSLVTLDKLINLFLILKFHLRPAGPAGQVAEFGSYRGGSAIFMAFVASVMHPGMRVYAFDTFEGMPETDRILDWHRQGDFSDVDFAEVERRVRLTGLANLELVRGRFEDVAQAALGRAEGGISLAHIDCDIYASVKAAWRAVGPRMAEGGYVVFDDAAEASCPGAMLAVEEDLYHRERRHAEQVWPHLVFRTFGRKGGGEA